MATNPPTIGNLILEARGVLQDTVVGIGGVTRYSDADLVSYFNDALLIARMKRPDIFLPMGLRNAVPQYQMPGDTAVNFPIDMTYWPAFVFYLVGFAELREDTFSDDSRATTLLNKFVTQLLQVAS